jgi:ABC-2 type transport system permease protein
VIRHFVWALRRELWENRWLYLAPVCMAVLLVAGFGVYALNLPAQMAAAATLGPAQQRAAILAPYDVIAGLMMITGLLVGGIYCVDALHGERRDRSVLLWKSLPVSDLMTVVAKIAIPVVVMPLVVWALTVAVHVVIFLASTAILAAAGQSAAPVWTYVGLVSNSLTLLYHLLALHGLLTAPLYAWLLLVSAWATRAPFAWAMLPPVAIVFLERVAFGTTRFAQLMLSRLSGGLESTRAPAGSTLMDSMSLLPLSHFVVTPALWAGFAVAAMFVVGTVRLRRSAQPL